MRLETRRPARRNFDGNTRFGIAPGSGRTVLDLERAEVVDADFIAGRQPVGDNLECRVDHDLGINLRDAGVPGQGGGQFDFIHLFYPQSSNGTEKCFHKQTTRCSSMVIRSATG